MFKKILPPRLLRSALFVLCLGSGAAQAAVTVSVNSPVSAGMATFTLNSGTATTGYLTVLKGNVSCGSVAETQAGKESSSADAYRRGSLALTAGTPASYTVRNLAHDAHYTVCATNGAEVARAIFSTPKMATYASPQWQTVGGAAVATGQAGEQSLSFAPDGKPYVAYPDGYRATVKQYNGSTWELVGNSKFSQGVAGYYSLSFAPNGTPYVAYQDDEVKATVRYFDVSADPASAWKLVGAASFSAGWVYYLSLAFAPDGTPYVAYQDRGNASQVMVMRYDTAIATPAWVSVGGGTASGGAIGYEPSLSFAPDGTPYVAYSESGSTTMVRRYVNDVWQDVGSSVGTAQSQSLSFAPDGTPYVAYVDGDQQSRITVKRLAGADWVIVGNALFSLEKSTGVSLAFAPDGVPYVAYSVSDEDDSDLYKTQVRRLETATWVAVGGTEFSGDSSSTPSLSFAPDGTPYVAYPDGSVDGKTIVKRLVSVPGAPTDVTAVAGNLQATVSFTAPASNGGSDITGYTVTTAPAGGVTSLPCTASPCTVTGLSNGTAYTFTVTANNGVGSSAASTVSGSVSPLLTSISIVGSPVVSAGMVTVALQSSVSGTGYLTVLQGSASCGLASETAAGKASGGTTDAYRRGSLVLAAGTSANYTVRNLAQSTAYTVCATDSAGSPVVSATFTTPAMASYDNSSWQTVGGAGFPTGDQAYPSLTFAPDGTPYVAYSDNSTNKTKVMRWVGGNWESVGSNELSAGKHHYPSLSFAPDGTPYVAYRDVSTSPIGKATVMHLVGSSWQAVGSPGFSAGEVFFPSLSFAPDGTPYVAYLDGNKAGKTTVMRWYGGSWVVVGSAGFSADVAQYQSLSFAPDGTPYVAYSDRGTSPLHKATVMHLVGSSWQAVGNPLGFSAGAALFVSLSFAPDGTPYVAYMDNSNSNKATVMRWGDSSWENVGIAGFSAGAAGELTLSFAPDGTPYVAYRDGSAYPAKTTVMRYGISWESVGSTGLSGGNPHFQSLSFAPDGTPYVAYWDKGSSTTGVITVQRLVGLPGAPTAVTAVAGDGQATVSFTAPASNGGSAVTYTVTAAPGGKTCTAMAPTTSCVVTGLTNNTAYTFTVTANNAGGASAASTVSAAVTPAASSTISIVGSPVVSAGMVTVTLNSSATGTGYLTVLQGSSANCGSVTDIQDGKASGGTTDAYRRGSLALAAGTSANYTVRNLAQSTAYTVCATDSAGSTVVSATFTTPAMTTYANPGWQTVGGAVSDGGTEHPSLSFAPDGKAYVAYSDRRTYSAKATVRRWSGAGWEAVGSAEFSDGVATHQSLSFAPDGTPYVAYMAHSSSGDITVVRWNGSSWSAVGGSAGFASNLQKLSLSFAPNGTPYVAYEDGSGNTVKRLVGTTWTAITSIASAIEFSLSFAPDGTLYVAYSDSSGSLSGKATVKRYSGGAWQTVGTAGFSTVRAFEKSFAFAPNGTPYVAYRENSTSKITVMSYDGTNGWVTVGDSAAHIGASPSLSFAPDGKPYVVYQGGTPSQTKVMRYNHPSWELVGAAVSSGNSDSPSLSFAPDGTPYVAYIDFGNSNKTIVKRLVGLPGAPTGVTAVPGSGQATVSFTAPAPMTDGSSPITSYTVTAAPGGKTCTATAPTTSCMVTGLSTKPHTFTVTATNSVGSSAASSASGAVTPSPVPPSISTAPTHHSAGVSVTVNEAGTGYWVLVPNGSVAPSAAQVKAGVNYGSPLVTVAAKGQLTLVAGSPATINLSGLAASSSYTLYFVAEDGSNNLQAIPSSVGVTTTAAPPPPDPGPSGPSEPPSPVKLQVRTSGAGTVQRSIAGSVVGTQGSTTTVQYAYAQAVTLTAQAQVGARFIGWSGACSGLLACSLTLYSDQAVQATFSGATCRSNNFSANEERVMGAYLAYYGRPADVAGLTYWAVYMAGKGGHIEAIIDAFGNSQEFQQRFGQMTGKELIANLYGQMYGRAPEADGAAFYERELASGLYSLASIAVNILDGTDGSDHLVLQSRKKVARHFVTRMEELGRSAPVIDDGDELARLLSGVQGHAESAEAGCAQVDSLLDKPAGQ